MDEKTKELLRKVKPLREHPETPYERECKTAMLRFRWIHAQCYQIELPDGKVLMTDPYFPQNPKAWIEEGTPALSVEDLGRVDYVTIGHSHYDHTDNVPDVFQNNSPIVICDRMYARELSCVYQIPEFNICPVLPGQTYAFESFQLETLQAKHNDLYSACDLEGKGFGHHELPAFGRLNSYGALFNLSYVCTFHNNNVRLGISAGVDVKGTADAWGTKGLDVLIRQRLLYIHAEDYAKECEAIGAPLVLPMHHDACFDYNLDMNNFTRTVNEIFQCDGYGMKMFNPQRLKWYALHMGVSACES